MESTVGGEYHSLYFNTNFLTKLVKYQISELLEYFSLLFHIQFLRKTSFNAHIAVIPFQKTLIKVIRKKWNYMALYLKSKH